MITILYSCFPCGLLRVPLEVSERGQENVVEYLEKVVAPVVSADHLMRSPFCSSRTMDELLIPLTPGSAKIGGAAVH
jgi:hypothetical protein